MTFTLDWLIFAFILGALSMLATVIVLSAVWVGRDGAPALPCGGDDDDDGWDGPDDFANEDALLKSLWGQP